MSLPDRDAILAFVRQTPSAVGKREIARAFGLHGDAREALKQLLAEMQEEGLLDAGPGRTLHKAGGLPRVAVLKVVQADGAKTVAEPDKWDGDGSPPKVVVARSEKGRGRPSERLQLGDRLLCRIEGDAGRYFGTVIKRLARGTSGAKALVLGVVRRDNEGALRLKPVDKRSRQDFALHHGEGVVPGEMVRAEIKGSGARTVAHVVERLGDPFATGSLSAIAIAAKGIPEHFSESVLADAERASSEELGEREDWTAIPFITIDPADARDHDDAVWAEKDGAGHRLIVAIADVSWFVRPGAALDRSAFDRGNSVYFPDRVVPMLPEALSNGACSLKAGADKAVLACDMRLSADGEVLRFSFHRARIRVVANLAYEVAQQIIDESGVGGETPPQNGRGDVLAPLWECWAALKVARRARGPLELDLPERRVELDALGNVVGVKIRPHLDAHQVIEDMMIAANVAAALALEGKKRAVMYRCHEAPSREKLTALKEYLGTLGVSFALGQVVTPGTFNRILEKAKGRDDATEISEAVLRSQTQAYYAPRNTGHFGLALGSYGHFTSPIRRYADVCVHRALVSGFKLGEGGLADGAEQRFAPIGEHISMTERRAMEAERETLDRYIARHLAQTVGQIVRARISGVQAFGFFATVDGIGGDGLVPVSALGAERFRFDEAGRFLEGAESGTKYGVGQRLDLRLEEADMATGSLRFSLPGVEAAERPRYRRDGNGPRKPARRGGPPPGVRRGRS